MGRTRWQVDDDAHDRLPPPLNAGRLSVAVLDAQRDARRIRSLIGVVRRRNNLDQTSPSAQNLLAYARYFRLPRERALRRTTELLDLIGLRGAAARSRRKTVGRHERRLMIARALLHEPRLLVLDEPTTGLDPHVRQEIWQRLEDCGAVGHHRHHLHADMDEAERLCDRLLVIDRGRLVAKGRRAKLVTQSFSNYALEVRDAADLRLRSDGPPPGSPRLERAGAHSTSRPTPELLTP